jgi:hypothetical protein
MFFFCFFFVFFIFYYFFLIGFGKLNCLLIDLRDESFH